ncbi:MAG: dual specificity protein phosphatase family protein [Amaricoccus sp.]
MQSASPPHLADPPPWQPEFDWLLDDLAVGACFPPGVAARIAREFGVGAVIDVRSEASDHPEELSASGLRFLHLPTDDACAVSQDMLDAGVAFAREAAGSGRKLLVHCQHGIGRSALVALCVLVDHGRAPLDALALAKDARGKISPNQSQYQAWADWIARRAPEHPVPTFTEFGMIAYRHLRARPRCWSTAIDRGPSLPCLIGDIEQTLGAARSAEGLARLDLATHALIAAGELAQAVADTELEAGGEDGDTPRCKAAMDLAVAVAAELLAAKGQLPRAPADPAVALEAVREHRLPPRLRCKLPEGFAFYAIYPEAYALAAAAADPAPTLVIGLRSIGTVLAAVVAARLGCPALTLRPRGHPFRRHVRASPALRQRLACHGGRFAIVDEGPGLSGSSFGAAADLLEELGVPLERMLFITSHGNELGAFATPEHRGRWARSARAVAASDVSARDVQAWFADATGPLDDVEDLSGGTWRRDLPSAPRPPAAPVAERLKFRLTSPGGRFLARFAGLGAIGEEKLAVARHLHAADLAPEPLALRRGFLLERWCVGTPLDPADTRGERFFAHLARYLGFRARSLSAGDGASLGELRRMAAVNAAEMGGAALGHAVEARLAAAESITGIVPARIDGRLHAWEWLRRPDGSFVKTTHSTTPSPTTSSGARTLPGTSPAPQSSSPSAKTRSNDFGRG